MSTETEFFRVHNATGPVTPQILCRITETMSAGLRDFSDAVTYTLYNCCVDVNSHSNTPQMMKYTHYTSSKTIVL